MDPYFILRQAISKFFVFKKSLYVYHYISLYIICEVASHFFSLTLISRIKFPEMQIFVMQPVCLDFRHPESLNEIAPFVRFFHPHTIARNTFYDLPEVASARVCLLFIQHNSFFLPTCTLETAGYVRISQQKLKLNISASTNNRT